MKEIKEGVKTYLELNKTDYALQINGEWGIGKTYYVKNVIQPFIESQEVNDVKGNKNKDNRYKFIYISLNGLKNVEEIGDRILFANLNGLETGFALTQSILKIGPGLAGLTGPLGWWSKLFSESALHIKKEIQSKSYKMLNLKQMVLCFDDLERIDPSINMEQVLGFINTNFVEHGKVKTIFVSNQDKVKDIEAFIEKKEKVIGRTLTYNRPITDILENYWSDIYKNEYLDFLNENIEFVKKSIEAASMNNLRTLRFTLDNFSVIFQSLDNDFFEHDEWLKENKRDILCNLFVFNLILSNEYKEGEEINLEELNFDSHSIYFRHLFEEQHLNKTSSKTEEYQKKIINKYFKNKIGYSIIKDFYAYFNQVGILVIDGVLNQKLLKDEITKYIPKEEKSMLALNQMFNYLTLELNEVRETAVDIIEHLKKGNYDVFHIPSVFQILNELKEKGYIEYDMDEIFKLANKEISSSFEGKNQIDGIPDLLFENKFNNKVQDEKYLELVSTIRELRNRYNEESKGEKMQNFLDSLHTMEDAEINNSYKDIQHEENWFFLINKTPFANTIVNMNNKGIGFFSSIIKERYVMPYANSMRQIESKDLDVFISNLKGSIDSVDDKLKTDVLKELLSTLEKALSLISEPLIT
ncbi:hypothetical protein SAMN05878482_101861 [Peribacillus simplex]|uniref:KAP NTPase domain-containing protein n=1 Tax=Peribacillus simplex TaxID=1478 RepID=A0A9X8R429_9BACI|nr:P-loop NTPase fold protein [Peribacillus simplex]SIQ29553.1 hypothetical protein SAMN05878482_101861 [Peribacillus simplex]